MKTENLLMIAAIGVAAYFIVNKSAIATASEGGNTPQIIVSPTSTSTTSQYAEEREDADAIAARIKQKDKSIREDAKTGDVISVVTAPTAIDKIRASVNVLKPDLAAQQAANLKALGWD